jgi:hypothetical protein
MDHGAWSNRPGRTAITGFALTAGMVMHGCGIFTPGVGPVPVQAVDAHGISLDRARSLRHGDRAESVIAVLGEPADRPRSCVPGEVIWRYPIRAWNDKVTTREIVPAVLLRIRFDGSGVLTDWGFVEPSTGRPLAVQDTVDEASRWFQSLSAAPPPRPPRIALHEVLIPGRTTQQEVERAFGRWRPDLFCGQGGAVPVVKKSAVDSGSVWDWYVDRPSSLFIPPYYLIVTLSDTGIFIVWHVEGTYPGGRK